MVNILRRYQFSPFAITTGLSNVHESVAVESYARVTSPLRRYSDLFSHYQIKGFLRGGTKSLPFTKEKAISILDEIHYTSKMIDFLQQRANRFWKMRFLLYQSNTTWNALIYMKGILLNSLQQRNYRCYVEQLGVSINISTKAEYEIGQIVPLQVVITNDGEALLKHE